jgi:hypothetical protein
MSNYTKLTDFASKDALPSGSANKIVKGTEIDDEFEGIETAVNSKADKNSPTFTGTPLAPTATAGTNSTQVATTAFVTTAVSNGATTSAEFVNAVYPVGSIYTNATVSTNPSTLLGHGSWAAFGAGRVLVGLDSGDTDFDTAEETGGAKTHTLIEDEIPAHTHTTGTTGSSYLSDVAGGGSRTHPYQNGGTTSGSTGSGAAHNNLQPYITVYMWKRTA